MLNSRMENRYTPRWRKVLASNVQTIRVASLRNKAIAFCGFNGVSGLMADHLRQQIALDA
jgi:hypothetical protein